MGPGLGARLHLGPPAGVTHVKFAFGGFPGASFLAPGSLARRKLARLIHHHHHHFDSKWPMARPKWATRRWCCGNEGQLGVSHRNLRSPKKKHGKARGAEKGGLLSGKCRGRARLYTARLQRHGFCVTRDSASPRAVSHRVPSCGRRVLPLPLPLHEHACQHAPWPCTDNATSRPSWRGVRQAEAARQGLDVLRGVCRGRRRGPEGCGGTSRAASPSPLSYRRRPRREATAARDARAVPTAVLTGGGARRERVV